MALETWLSFVLASFVLTMTPGPSILLGVVHSLNYGVKKTIYTVFGDISANFLQMIIVAVGLGIIISNSIFAFQVIKWFGVITLLYMGLKMILSKPQTIERTNCNNTMSPKKMYMSGFLVAAGNPKAIVFFSAFFPQFINPNESLFYQMAILCPTMALLDFTWVMIYAISANKFFDKFQTKSHYINRAGGGALLGASGFLSMSSK